MIAPYRVNLKQAKTNGMVAVSLHLSGFFSTNLLTRIADRCHNMKPIQKAYRPSGTGGNDIEAGHAQVVVNILKRLSLFAIKFSAKSPCRVFSLRSSPGCASNKYHQKQNA
jgi:hypothetical protein